MHWLRRLKGLLVRQPRLEPPAADPVRGPAQEPAPPTPSPVEQNLSWLPVYEAPQPLNELPPGCPPLGREYEALRSRYLAFVGHAQKYYPQALTDECRQQGHELARALHSKALDLSSSKATTDSLDIYWFMQCAALVSLFAHGAHSVAFSRYRKDVDYYKDHNLTRQQVEAFGCYVRAFTPELPSGNLLPMRGPQDARSRLEPMPQVEDMDELLSFLPRLYPGGIAIKTYTVREGTYWPEYAEVVTDFFCAVGKDCWNDFDYLNHGAAVMIENPACIAQASLADIQSMLTWCVRGERFCDGHHGSVIEKGYVLNVLRRIEVLRAAMR